jgi:hypothetical protein
LERCLDLCSINEVQLLRDDAFFNGYVYIYISKY